LQLLETTKPFLMNVTRVGALPTALLFANQVDISPDFLHLVVDEWLEIQFANTETCLRMLKIGIWLRYAWMAVIDRKLLVIFLLTLNFNRNQTIKSFSGLGTGVKDPVYDYNSHKPQHNLRDQEGVPAVIVEFRDTWKNIYETGTPDGGVLEEEDVMDKLVELVDLDVEYSCNKLKLTSVSDIFGYEPYNSEIIKKYRICVTPHFNYYMSKESFKGSRGFQLPHVVKCLTDLPIPISNTFKNPESISDEEKQPEIRRHYDCIICGKSLLLTTLEIFKHKKNCQ
jgi:hypothetical protein